MAKRERTEDEREGSFPAGNFGGRVHVPIFHNKEGGDASIDPDAPDIYSGMLKRTARQTGRFCDSKYED